MSQEFYPVDPIIIQPTLAFSNDYRPPSQGHPSVDPHRAGIPTQQELHQDPGRRAGQLLEPGSALHGQEPKEPT